MKFGLDRLIRESALRQPLRGRRVALLAHPASVTSDLTHALDALVELRDVRLTAAFGPQHGLRGDKQDNMVESSDFQDPIHGIPVFSLYGEVRRPTAQMMDCFDEVQSSIVCVEEVDRQATASYGILDADAPNDGLTRIRGLVEKPEPEDAPSNLAIIGRYILTPEIFGILENKETGAGGEIQITDAMARLLDTQSIYGFSYEGTRFDCGTKVGFQMANISFAMDRKDMHDRLMPFIKDLCA